MKVHKLTRCRTCSAIGDHTTNDCPARASVGLPSRVTSRAPSERPEDVLPNYICGDALDARVRKDSAVPESLACSACSLLAIDAVWCQTCDRVCCETCLGPSELHWLCPLCGATSGLSDADDAPPRRLHVVGPLRTMAAAWFMCAAAQIDPWCVTQWPTTAGS